MSVIIIMIVILLLTIIIIIMSIVLAIILGMIMIFTSKVHHYTINEDLSPHSGIKTQE